MSFKSFKIVEFDENLSSTLTTTAKLNKLDKNKFTRDVAFKYMNKIGAKTPLTIKAGEVSHLFLSNEIGVEK